MGKKCTQFRKSRKFFVSVMEGLKKKRQAVKILKFNLLLKKQAQNNTIETSDEPVPST